MLAKNASIRSLIALCLLFAVTAGAAAEDTFRFPEGRHGKGEFKYVNEVPVLFLRGTPEEMGEQYGVLLGETAKPLLRVPKEMLKQHGIEAAWPFIVIAAKELMKNLPDEYQRELRAGIKASGLDADTIIVANMMLELRRMGGCSSFIVHGAGSKTGGPLFGRNLDLPPIADLYKYSGVIVCKPDGKRAFVAVGFPGASGVVSGINDAGLSVAMHDVYATNDKSTFFDPRGVSLSFCFRRLLEECATVKEAERLMRTMRATTWANLAVCDKKESAVFEITPKNLAVRPANNGVLRCTNHFRTDKLVKSKQCWRFERLEKRNADSKLGVKDVQQIMHEVNQGEWTVQSMAFEPAALKLHVALGRGPATGRTWRELDLKPLFEKVKAPIR